MTGSGKSIDMGLEELLHMVHTGELAIPDFQRSFVWPAGATSELVASIASDYPAGTLLLLENTGQFDFKPFEGAPESGAEPTYLVLDGQQRLTSLYQAFYGRGKRPFYAKWRNLMDKDAAFDDDAIQIRRANAKPPKEEEELFPLSEVFGGEGAVHWILSKENSELQADLESNFRKRWIDPMEKYRFPVVILGSRTPMEAVCRIFETLNRTGMKLTVFELLTAKLRPRGVTLRDMWEETLERSDALADFKVVPEDFLRIIGILVNPKSNDATKPKGLLKLTSNHVGTYWVKAEEGLSDALDLLTSVCGAVEWRSIPYPALAIPMAATLADKFSGAKKGAVRQKLTQWFWCSVFSEAYESGQATKMVGDYRELGDWISGGSAPDVVRTFKFDASELREVTSGASARYKGVLSLMLGQKPHDFHDDKEITAERVRNGEVDDHHVFPRAYLKSIGSSELGDSILNRALIDRTTNKRISSNAPSVYLGEIKKNWGPAAFKAMLDSHFLPQAPLMKNKFKEFLKQREELLGEAIDNVAKGKDPA